MGVKTKTIVTELIAGVFILLFLYTALSKVFELNDFQYVLRRSPLIGEWNIVVSWFVILSELIICMLLLTKTLKLWGLFFSWLLMGVFSSYILYLMVGGYDLPCRCGGVIKDLSWGQHLVFNSAFVLLGVTGWKLERDLTIYLNKPPAGGQAGVAEQL